jgi:uncharacterized GH25 family protein
MRLLLTALAALFLVTPLAAHDFWVEASQYRPKVGALVGLRLLVGQDMLGDPVRRDDAVIERFLIRRADGDEAVPGRDGADPAGIVRVAAPGLLAVGYQSRPRPVELPPDKFEQYLGEEGLDEIKSLFHRPAADGGVARELFSRCAKTLLQSGPVQPGEGDRPLGLPLELVAERNPYAAPAGAPLSFVLTYRGQPKANALVVAINRTNPGLKRTSRTDRQGRVTFELPAPGVWMVKAVHMIPAPKDAAADWQSFWASTTFDLP